MRSFTAEPEAIAQYGPLETEDGRVLKIEGLRPAKDCFVAAISGVLGRDAAEKLTNLKLYVPRERLPALAETDEFYHADLIGLAVVNKAGDRLGSVLAIHNFGAGDLIEVRLDESGRTEMVPFNELNVPSVDVAAGRIVIEPSPLAGEDK